MARAPLGLLPAACSSTSPPRGRPFWTRGRRPVAGAASAASRASRRRRCRGDGGPAVARGPLERGADPRGCASSPSTRCSCSAIYCAIPYKTPWCVLGFLHGMILLAGAGRRVPAARRPRPPCRALVLAILLARRRRPPRLAGLGGELPFPGRPAQPVRLRAHQRRTCSRSSRALEALAQAHPAGRALPVQVISRDERLAAALVPAALPERGVVDRRLRRRRRARRSSCITPDMEPALVRKLYDLPPPGERELYVSVFEQPVELRPAGRDPRLRRRTACGTRTCGGGGDAP